MSPRGGASTEQAENPSPMGMFTRSRIGSVRRELPSLRWALWFAFTVTSDEAILRLRASSCTADTTGRIRRWRAYRRLLVPLLNDNSPVQILGLDRCTADTLRCPRRAPYGRCRIPPSGVEPD